MSDGFISCPNHGDLFWQEGAENGTAIEVHLFERLRDDIELPKVGERQECPLCHMPVVCSVRPAVKVLHPKRRA